MTTQYFPRETLSNPNLDRNPELTQITSEREAAMRNCSDIKEAGRGKVRHALGKGIVLGVGSTMLVPTVIGPAVLGAAGIHAYEQETGTKLSTKEHITYAAAGALGLGIINPYTVHAFTR